MPTTTGLCSRAMATASAMWSKCPCVHSSTSTFLTCLCSAGQAGFSFSQGSMYTTRPPGVSTRKHECPSHGSFTPGRFMVVGLWPLSFSFSVLPALRPRLPPADQRDGVLESHLLQHPGRECRAIAAPAVEHDLLVLLGGHLVDL